MITKLKAIIFALFVFIPLACNAGYTTMTIEGVKQADGVWTAAGVMDSMGFVRSTGAVSVMGSTRNLPVAMAADTAAAGMMLRTASRLAGPVALAAAAYDVFQWATSTDIKACDNQFCLGTPAAIVPDEMDSLGCNYVDTGNNLRVWNAPLAYAACMQISYDNITSYIKNNGYKLDYVKVSPATVRPGYSNPAYDMLFDTVFTGRGTLASGYVYNYSKTITYVVRPPSSPFGYSNPKATDLDFNRLPNPSIPLIISGWTKLPSLIGKPTPIKSTSFTPYSDWFGEPYFKDGQWYRDRMDVSPCPTASQPNRVCVDIGPQKFEGATDPHTVPSQATGTASGSTPKENADFCKKNPQSIACAELGNLEDENLEVDERPVDVSYTPWGSSNSQCPADKIIPLWDSQSIALSYGPICQFASLLRPLVIALAFVAAGFIVAGITRKGGGDA